MTDPNSSPPQDPRPSFLRRVSIAFGTFFRAFSDADYAARVDGLRDAAERTEAPEQPLEPQKPAVSLLRETSPEAALQLLGLLQRDARLIDFAMENLSAYSDQEIGAAARVVHEGCRKVLAEHFTIAPVRDDAEGSSITLQEGFNASEIRLTGNVVGKAPFRGSLTHRGWRAAEVRLPKLTEAHDATVIAPAEVEL